MKRIGNLTIIGTSHISKDSIVEIRNFIETEKPEIVAVELDYERYKQMLSKKKEKISITAIKHIGLSGYIFAVVGKWAQKKLGDFVGIEPGSDMMTAVKLAKDNNLKLELIDQDIRITLYRFSKAFRAKEKWNIVKEVFSIPFKKKKLPFDISKIPSKEVIEKLIDEFKFKYPGLYKVLITERNMFMAEKLKSLMTENKKILAVVGAGHEQGMSELLNRPMYSFSFSHDP